MAAWMAINRHVSKEDREWWERMPERIAKRLRIE